MSHGYTLNKQVKTTNRNSYFGTRVARTNTTIYQAETNGFVTFSTSGYSAAIYVGASSPPTIDVAEIHFTGGSGGAEMMAFVPSGWYYSFSSGDGFWIPINYS